MINNLLKNICLISFALVGPISLPAGGIQKNLNEYMNLDNSKEMILTSNCPLYTYPRTNAKKLKPLQYGSNLSILQKWKSKDRNTWLRVELSTNMFIENTNISRRGWIKM